MTSIAMHAPAPRSLSWRPIARPLRLGLVLAVASALGACSLWPAPAHVGPGGDDPCLVATSSASATSRRTLAGVEGAPERATGYSSKSLVVARRFVAVTAHPLATRAACEVLRDGGTAMDAAVAAQMVLNVVEPQSSGLGGGAFALHWDATRRVVSAWDGRETAPAASTPDDLRWIDASDRRVPQPNARESGRSVGTPGVVHMLEAAHRAHGRLPWAQLFAPAIAWADRGFEVSPRLAASIATSRDALARDPAARALFLDATLAALPPGARLANPALAATLRTVADGGAEAFYRGPIAQAIVDAAADTRGGSATPGKLTLADLEAYRSRQRAPLCAPYRALQVCGMPPPSSGGLAVAQALGMLESFDLTAWPPAASATGMSADGGRPDVRAVHVATEALRLAFADRDRYVADPDFVPLPGTRDGSAAAMLDPAYLRRRAATIDAARSMGTAAPGRFDTVARAPDAAQPPGGTTHLSIVDADGNAVVMTSSIESAFGAYRMTRGGFLLNNQLTDFAAAPVDAQGRPVANRLEALKRPRSSMAPTLLLRPDAQGRPEQLVMATGSPGGAAIIHYVLKSVVAVVDWGLDAQQAASLVSFGAFNTPATFIGGEHPALDLRDDGRHDPLIAGLRERGHEPRLQAQVSGLAVIVRRCDRGPCRLEAGADPRREGVAAGR